MDNLFETKEVDMLPFKNRQHFRGHLDYLFRTGVSVSYYRNGKEKGANTKDGIVYTFLDGKERLLHIPDDEQDRTIIRKYYFQQYADDWRNLRMMRVESPRNDVRWSKDYTELVLEMYNYIEKFRRIALQDDGIMLLLAVSHPDQDEKSYSHFHMLIKVPDNNPREPMAYVIDGTDSGDDSKEEKKEDNN